MARVLTDAERGPLGAWAYNTRALLQLSDEQVASRAGVTPPTIRKVESGKAKPSARVLFEVARYFREVGERQQVPVEPPPGVTADVVAPPPDLSALVREVTALVATLRPLAERAARESDYEDRLAGLERVVARLVERDPSAGATPSAPAPTGR